MPGEAQESQYPQVNVLNNADPGLAQHKINILKGPSQAIEAPEVMHVEKMSQGYYQQHPPPASMASYYMQQPGHILINPPHLPTYNYGIPPSPMVYHNPMYPPGSLPMSSRHTPTPPQTPLRRAGSINAKIYSADARYLC